MNQLLDRARKNIHKVITIQGRELGKVDKLIT